jgi:hypothetical protein
MFSLILPPYVEFANATAADAAALRLTLDGEGGCAMPAALAAPWWERDSRCEALVTRADAHLQLIARMLHAHGAGTATLAAEGVSAPDLAAAVAWRTANAVTAQFIATSQSALLQARLAGRLEAHAAVAAEVLAALAALVRDCVAVLERRRDWALARATQSAPAAAAGGGGPFWRTFLAVVQGEAVPAARGAHPRLARMLDKAARAVLVGPVAPPGDLVACY